MKLIQVLLVLLLLVALAVAAFFAYSGQGWDPGPIPTDEATFTYSITQPAEIRDLYNRIGSVEDEGLVEAVTKQYHDRYGSIAPENRFDLYYDLISSRLMLLDTISSWYGSPLGDDQFEISCADAPGVYEALVLTGRLELRWEADPVAFSSLSPGEYPQEHPLCYRWLQGDYLDEEANTYLIQWLDPKDPTGRVFGTPEFEAVAYTPDGLWLSFEDEAWLEYAGRYADGRRLAVILDNVVVALVEGSAAQSMTIETGWHPDWHWGEPRVLAQILEQKLYYPDDVALEVRYGGMHDESSEWDGDWENAPEMPHEDGPGTPDENAPSMPNENAPSMPNENAPSTPNENAPGMPSENAPSTPNENAPGMPSENAPG